MSRRPTSTRGARRRRPALWLRTAAALTCLGSFARAEPDERPTQQLRGAEPAGPRAETDQPAESSGPKSPLELLSFYEHNYITSALRRDDAVKFQFSIKYNLWPTEPDPSGRFPGPRHGVYFGYTQLVVWDAWDFENSSPMKDINYRPQLFYRYGHSSPARSGCAFYSARAGLRHASNGEDGTESRGMNVAFAAARVGCAAASGTRFRPLGIVELEAWTPPPNPKDNPDIIDYLGLFEVQVRLASDWRSHALEGGGAMPALGILETAVHVRPAFGSGEVSLQVDGIYQPPFPRGWQFTPHLYVQYFNGFVETLLTYDRRTEGLRFGLGFSDRVQN